MSPQSTHRYTPLADPELDESGEAKKSPTAASFTGGSSTTRTVLLMLLSGIAGAFMLSLFQNISGTIRNSSTAGQPPQMQRLGNLLSFSSETVKFLPNTTFASPASPETDEAWMQLLGPSKGFISLADPESYGLAPGRAVQGSSQQVYGVTMFHQLHCLIMIRDIHFGLLQGKYNASDYDSTGESEKSFVFEHTEHCFDFLQQSIRCAGLVQIELPHGARNNIFDGYGSEHTCKSWSEIEQFMQTHKTPDRSGGSEEAA